MPRLQTCPACSRPSDVAGLTPGTPIRCPCSHTFPVGRPRRTEPGRTCGHCGAPVPPDARACTHCGTTLGDCLCPVCHVRNPRGASFCVGCGNTLTAQHRKALTAETACPRCGGELSLRLVDGVGELVECAACTGLWMEPEDFDRACARAAAGSRGGASPPRPAEGPLAYVPCLRCGDLMVRRQFQWSGRRAGVVVDVCGDHGVWLDADELEQVTAFVRAVGTDPGFQPSPTRRPGLPTAGRDTGPLPALPARRKGFFDVLLDVLDDFLTGT